MDNSIIPSPMLAESITAEDARNIRVVIPSDDEVLNSIYRQIKTMCEYGRKHFIWYNNRSLDDTVISRITIALTTAGFNVLLVEKTKDNVNYLDISW